MTYAFMGGFYFVVLIAGLGFAYCLLDCCGFELGVECLIW